MVSSGGYCRLIPLWFIASIIFCLQTTLTKYFTCSIVTLWASAHISHTSVLTQAMHSVFLPVWPGSWTLSARGTPHCWPWLGSKQGMGTVLCTVTSCSLLFSAMWSESGEYWGARGEESDFSELGRTSFSSTRFVFFLSLSQYKEIASCLSETSSNIIFTFSPA